MDDIRPKITENVFDIAKGILGVVNFAQEIDFLQKRQRIDFGVGPFIEPGILAKFL